MMWNKICRSVGGAQMRTAPSRRKVPFWSILVVALALVETSLQQENPVTNFCRRFGHQSAVVDSKLYIDGGFIDWNPITSYPENYTNTWLSYHDLTDISSTGMPTLFANLSKNSSIPSVNGGVLWADDVNKRIYLFGGEYYQAPPTTFNLYAYDVLENNWDNFGLPQTPIQALSYGAGLSISDTGQAYYYGGWMSNNSVPNWVGPPVATANMVTYTMDSNTWINSTGPDAIPRAEGVMTYIPVSDGGMLVYFGGIQDLFGNGTVTGQPMNQILLYDVLSTKWYAQNASGTVPDMRRRFCAGAAWAQDQSSYNIYLYGGAGMPPNTAGFDDVYVLSIPSFTWIKMYPLNPSNTSYYPHHSLTCNVIDNAQMLVIGGTFPLSDDCDAPTQWGEHNMDLGQQNDEGALWELFATNKTSYVVPPEILSVIGGSPQGGATATTPVGGFGNADLQVLMTRKASAATRAPTRVIPNGSGSPAQGSLSTGAIVGIAVGGAVALIAAAIACFCLIRKHRQRHFQAATVNPGQGYQDSHSGLGPHAPSTAWSLHSSRFGPQSPYTPHSPYSLPPTMPPHVGPPVELPVGSNQFPQGYFAEAPVHMSEQPKYDAQGNAWIPQVSTVQVPGHRHSPSGSPLHDNIQPVPAVAGYPYQQYTTAAATPQHHPQELDPDPRMEEPENRSEPRHQTYYHP